MARAALVAREGAAHDGDRVLRWIVWAYVLAVIGSALVVLVGLWEGWW